MNREDLRGLFSAKSARVDTNRGKEYYDSLYERCKLRLEELKKLKPLNKVDIKEVLEDEGINRRDFLKWASAMTATLMLPASFTPLVAEAAEVMNRVPVI